MVFPAGIEPASWEWESHILFLLDEGNTEMVRFIFLLTANPKPIKTIHSCTLLLILPRTRGVSQGSNNLSEHVLHELQGVFFPEMVRVWIVSHPSPRVHPMRESHSNLFSLCKNGGSYGNRTHLASVTSWHPSRRTHDPKNGGPGWSRTTYARLFRATLYCWATDPRKW